MAALQMNAEILNRILDERAQKEEIISFLEEVIDDELARGDEADCDLIDACVEVLESEALPLGDDGASKKLPASAFKTFIPARSAAPLGVLQTPLPYGGRGVRLRRAACGGDRRLSANRIRRRACKTRPAKTGSHFHRGKHRSCSARRTHHPSTGDRTRNGSHRSSTDYARNDPSARGAKT